MLEIGAALFYYKLGLTLLQIGAVSLLQIGASFVTNWGSYYKLTQPLLHYRAAVRNHSKIYYKLGQVLQIRAIIGNWGRAQGPLANTLSNESAVTITKFCLKFITVL